MGIFNNINISNKLLALVSISVFIGCEKKTICNSTYFGGKIINPKTNHIVLFENETPLDTFYLNNNNSFLGEITSLNEGLFYFKHGNENQYVYLEPKDSLLIRLNTWNFDETLVFSGKGAEKNNLLIDSFLESEKDKKIFYSYYDLPPLDFNAKVLEVEKIKLARYNEFVFNNPESSEKYNSILKIALTYPLYSKVENYPLAHSAKINDGKHQDINSSFYKHREFIDTDKDSLMYFYAYRDYIVSNLYNKTYSLGYDLASDEFTIDLLNIISEQLNNENSINSMLRRIFITHFYRKSSSDINMETFNTYLKLSTSNEDEELVKNLILDCEKIKKGIVIQNFDITDYNKTKRSVKSLIKNKKAVLYFWNSDFISKDFIGRRIQYLSKKYPDLKFIGIKIVGDHKDRIYKLDIKSQYYLELDSKANSFLTSKMPRTILVDKKGFVINDYASLSSRKIFKQIERLAKK
tara:strand:+ start:4751 stop:6145 length:1395 start_codon:yes stop_codon:yes gene_type:complete